MSGTRGTSSSAGRGGAALARVQKQMMQDQLLRSQTPGSDGGADSIIDSGQELEVPESLAIQAVAPFTAQYNSLPADSFSSPSSSRVQLSGPKGIPTHAGKIKLFKRDLLSFERGDKDFGPQTARNGNTYLVGLGKRTDGKEIYAGLGNRRLFEIAPDGTSSVVLMTQDEITCSMVHPNGTVYVGARNTIQAVLNGSSKQVLNLPVEGTYAEIMWLQMGPAGVVYVGSIVWDDEDDDDLETEKWPFTTSVHVFVPGKENETARCVLTAKDATFSAPVVRPSDGTAYIASSEGDLFRLDSKGATCVAKTGGTNRVFGNSPTGKEAETAIGPDETIFFVGCDDQVYSFDTNGNLKVFISSPSDGIVVTSDGTVLYINGRELYAKYPDGTSKMLMRGTYGLHGRPAVGPDDTVYISENLGTDGILSAVPLTGGDVEDVLSVECAISSPSIKDDGTIGVRGHDGYFHYLSHSPRKA